MRSDVGRSEYTHHVDGSENRLTVQIDKFSTTIAIGPVFLERSTKQLLARRDRIRKEEQSKKHSWLLVRIRPYRGDFSGDQSAWLEEQLTDLALAMPANVYKLVVVALILRNKEQDVFLEMGTVRFGTNEGFQVFVMPTIGMIALRAPAGNTKSRLEEAGFACEWNLPVGAAFYGSDCGSIEQGGGGEFEAEIGKLREKFGSGKDAVLTTIDSGICATSRDIDGRILAQFEVKPHPDGGFSNLEVPLARESYHHGTEVASIAVGKEYGVAPEARVISIKLPLRADGKFDQFALYAALDMILSERGPLVNDKRIRQLTSTLLLSHGFLNQKRIDEGFREQTATVLRQLTERYDIAIVAAVGNQPGLVAFPGSYQFVCAVGSLGRDGKRSNASGFGSDSTGNALPNCHIVGEGIVCESKDARAISVSGTSFAAARVAGIFTLLAAKWPSAQSRWSKINGCISVEQDENGDLRKLDLSRI